MRIFWLLGILALAGCAAQMSYQEYYEVRDLVAKAKKKEPQNSDLEKAELQVEAGRDQLRSARYSRASHHFRGAKKAAEDVLGIKTPATASQRAPASMDDFMEGPAPMAKVESVPSEPDPKMMLPKEALSKYLAAKKASGFLIPPPKTKVSEVTAKPASAQASIAASKSAEKTEEKPKVIELSAKPEARVPTSALAIPSLPGDEEALSLAKEATENILVKPEPPRPVAVADAIRGGDEPVQLAPLNRKFVGKVEFGPNPNSTDLDSAAMNALDTQIENLNQNLSMSIIFVPTMAENETPTIVDARFESITAYFRSRQVADDQVRLEGPRKTGSKAQFEMYLVDQ